MTRPTGQRVCDNLARSFLATTFGLISPVAEQKQGVGVDKEHARSHLLGTPYDS